MSDMQQMENGLPAAPVQVGRRYRQALIRSVAVVVILLAGIMAVKTLQAAMDATFDKLPAPLSKPLPLMPHELGTPVRYIATKPDQVLDEETIETLGTSDYLVREYTDNTKKAGEPGQTMNFNVNYYATGSSTPHVPEVCWAGTGREEAGDSRRVFAVNGIPRANGTSVDVRMRLISFKPVAGEPTAAPDGTPMYDNVAYVFQVNGDYVSNPDEVMSRFWKATNKYAYHCKLEVTPMDASDPRGEHVLTCTQMEAEKIVSDFIREALPAAEECLPNPAILTQRADSGERFQRSLGQSEVWGQMARRRVNTAFVVTLAISVSAAGKR